MDDNNLIETVDSLIDSMDDVEDALEPLLSKSLQDSLASANGPIERAKILFWVAYTIHSCTWAFTKTAAIDPEAQGVLEELDRIKQYNGKITAAVKRAEGALATKEDTGAVESQASKRRMPLDKDAASRFITAAIANQPSKPNSNSSFYSAEASVSDPLAGPGPHTRLSSLARISSDTAEKGSEGAEAGSSSDSGEDLQVYASMVPNTSTASAGPSDITGSTDIPSGNRDSRETNQAQADKQKRKQEKKRKRLLGDGLPATKKVQDPFSGYDVASDQSKGSKAAKPAQLATGSQNSSRAGSVVGGQTDSSAAAPSTDGDKKKKKRKKNKKDNQ